MKIIHFCAGLEYWNGMANTARQLIAEERMQGHDSRLTNNVTIISAAVSALGRNCRVHIHGTWLPVLWKVAKIAKDAGAELIVRPAGNYDPLRLNRGFLSRLKKLLVAPQEHAMLNRADVVQATCEAEAEWIRAYHPSANVEVTDLKRFFFLGVEERRRDRKGDDKRLHVLYLGRRDPLKGVRYLKDAVKEVNLESKAQCGEARIDLHLVSKKTGDALVSEWDWCDVLCLPTLSENFGRVIAEALERGKRVITTDGAPAWAPSKDADKGQEEWRSRLTYISGFRDATDETRVQLLKSALSA